MTAYVNEVGILFRYVDPLRYPSAWWEKVLDALKAHHLPSEHQIGQRMSTIQTPASIQSHVRFTAQTVRPVEAIKILSGFGIEVKDVREKGTDR